MVPVLFPPQYKPSGKVPVPVAEAAAALENVVAKTTKRVVANKTRR